MKAQFEKAKQLIKVKRYEEARALLEKINHPVAAKWLHNLDQIAPRKAATGSRKVVTEPRKVVTEPRKKVVVEPEDDIDTELHALLGSIDDSDEPETPLFDVPEKSKKAKLPWGEPWNPDAGQSLSVLSFFMPLIMHTLYNIFYALNWRRLGKPNWMWIALAASLITGLGFWVSLPILVISGAAKGIPFSVIMVILIGFMASSFGLSLLQRNLQAPAYAKWNANRDANAMYQHQYPLARSISLHTAGTAIFAVVLFVAINGNYQPQKFTDAALTLEYPQSWETLVPAETNVCSDLDADERCLVVMVDNKYGYGGLAVFENPRAVGMTIQERADIAWKNIAAYDQGVLISRTDLTIDKLPAVALEYTFQDGEQKTWHGLLVMIFSGDHYYRVFGYSSKPENFEKARTSFQQIYTSVDFTNG